MTKKTEKLALIDMDGTVADYNKSMVQHLELMASPDELPIKQDLSYTETHIKARMKLIKKQPGFWFNLPIIPLGFQVVNYLDSKGFSKMVLTKGPTRTTSAWTEKRDWCHKHLPDVPVTVTEDKSNYYGKVLFDDWPPYVLGWLEWRPRGLAIMLDHSWNKDFTHPNVIKISSSKDLVELGKRLDSLNYNII